MPETIVRVVSLVAAVKRREIFSRDAVGGAVDWSFFPACSAVEPPLVYNQRMAIQKAGRPLTPAELGCYTSHYKVWQAFIESDAQQIVVMEDDLLVDWPFFNKLLRHDFSEHG